MLGLLIRELGGVVIFGHLVSVSHKKNWGVADDLSAGRHVEVCTD